MFSFSFKSSAPPRLVRFARELGQDQNSGASPRQSTTAKKGPGFISSTVASDRLFCYLLPTNSRARPAVFASSDNPPEKDGAPVSFPCPPPAPMPYYLACRGRVAVCLGRLSRLCSCPPPHMMHDKLIGIVVCFGCAVHRYALRIFIRFRGAVPTDSLHFLAQSDCTSHLRKLPPNRRQPPRNAPSTRDP